MATESPIRLVEASEKWPPRKDAASFGQSSVAVERLGLPFEGRFKGDGRNVVPNRCESAPPSVEGSIAAFQNLMTEHNSILLSGLARPASSIYDSEPENQWRANSDYLTCDSFNNVNKRISPPFKSWKNDLLRGIGNSSSDWKVKSHDDIGKRSLQANLPTHKEEPEDDGSPQQKNSVGLMQSDISFAQSPATNESGIMSYGSLEEVVDHDADMREATCAAPATASVSCSSSASPGGASARQSLYRRHSPTYDLRLVHNVSTCDDSDSDVARIEPAIEAVDISTSQNSKSNILKNHQQRSQNILPKPQVHQQQHTMFKLQGPQTEMTSRVNYLYSGMPQFHDSSASSATEGPPILQSSGYTPPLYTTATALMTSPEPFYPNIQLPGYFHPQFAAGGYAMNPTVHLPYLAGYSPYGAVPQAFQGATSPATGVSGGGNTKHTIDPLLDRFYGQLGHPMQPSLSDPLHMQYFQQPFRDAYSFYGHLDNLTPKDSAVSSLDLRKWAEVVTFMADQKVQLPEGVGHSLLNPSRRGNITSHYYLGSPTNIGPLMQFPAPPVASPVFPWSSGVGTSFGGGRNGMKFSSIASRSTGVYAARQGQDVENSVCSLLEELKSGKGRRFDLSDITGRIVEFSTDQHGSRFIQQKLESCSVEEKSSVFKEILPQAAKLMTDVFGNYVIQKFFEYGTTEQQKDLADQLEGQVLTLSLQMYGCRVIQKALDVIQLEQKVRLVQELDGHVMRCVRDQNGNHVIQKCIESIPIDKIQFIISSFSGQVAQLSTHPYGCRVIQRVLEHCVDQLQSQFIVDEILESVCALAQDQYGNYVTQHILEKGKPDERSQIIRKLSGRVMQLSQHKFASNVIEKCLEYGDSSSRELLIGEIIGNSDGNDNLLVMMKDQYANYVVQKILRTCTDAQRETLHCHIENHIDALKKYTFGKHIVARFEQLYGEAD